MGNLIAGILICAIIWWLWRRRQTSKNSLASTSAPILIDAKHNVYARPNSPAEEHFAALHREATQHKENGDWEKAIACLREAENLNPFMPVKSAVRLPLFLQQAGHFDEAILEFQKLLDNTEDRVLNWLPKRNISSKKMLIHADLMHIYQSMHTACKREKLQEQANEYAELAEKHKAQHAKLLKAEQARDTKKIAERRKKRQAGI